VIEMSQSNWLVAALVPGVKRQPLKRLDADEAALLKLLNRWRNEAGQAGHQIKRIVVAYVSYATRASPDSAGNSLKSCSGQQIIAKSCDGGASWKGH
jgi:hypothetical protein